MKSSGDLPDYLVIGAQKAGTTSLYRYMISHPMIRPASDKQVHYFDFNYDKPFDWYRSQFPAGSGNGLVTGEATPYYIFHPDAARRVRLVLPDVKIVALLRNPIDRACSHYMHEIKNGTESLSFEDAVEAEEGRLRGEEDKICEGVNYYSYNHVKFSYLARGTLCGTTGTLAGPFSERAVPLSSK